MSKICITIAICTWNRSKSLCATLTSLQKMLVPANIEWELLVINNNCTDDTDAVIASFTDTLPIRSLLETQQGLSNARNRAVDAARGDYILWTDDDVMVGPGWLVTYAEAFENWPGAAFFGGPIIPKFEGKPPAWLLMALQDDKFADAYCVRDLGAEPIEQYVEESMTPYGANFAVRMHEQRRFRYNPRLGLHKDDHIRGDETDVIKRILNCGFEGRWIPNAPVHHVIAKHRQTKSYVRDYFKGEGRGIVRHDPTVNLISFLGAPRWLWRAAVSSRFRFYLKRLIAPPEIWSQELRIASIYWGQLLEYRAIKRHFRQPGQIH